MIDCPSSSATGARSVSIYLPDLSGGGAERLHLGLTPLFIKAGFDVTLLLDRCRGQLLDALPPGVRIVTLDARRQIQALPRLVRYLRTAKPSILVANMEHMNIMALLARQLARVRTRVIICQHNTLSEQAKRPGWKFKILPFLYRIMASRADGIVAVSQGVASDMSACSDIKAERISVIYNGAIDDGFAARAAEPCADLWAEEDTPRLVAVGRFVPQKDFPTLLEAFAIASRRSKLRLLILGDGPQREELTALCTTLGVASNVRLPGFVANPLPYIRAADMLVLASRFEGFGLVLAEALACGTKVVSTDCPHGPAEILEGGRYGMLVPVGDAGALADAIQRTLDTPADLESLRRRGRVFSFEQCAKQYIELFVHVLETGQSPVPERTDKSAQILST